MKCPKCGSEQNYVTDSRSVDGIQLRRRKCCGCGYIYKTQERYEPRNHTSISRGIPAWMIRRDNKRINKEINHE